MKDRSILHLNWPDNTTLQPWQFYLVILGGWIHRQRQEVIEYLRTEKQVLKEKLGPKRILLNDVEDLYQVALGCLGRHRLHDD